MEPTIKPGQQIYVDTAAYERTAPKRWDVVVLSTGTNNSPLVFRLWGMPGETLDFHGGTLRVNGTKVDLPPRLQKVVNLEEGLVPAALPFVRFPYTVSQSGYFVMGDNLRNSFDSRFWGEAATNRVLGKLNVK